MHAFNRSKNVLHSPSSLGVQNVETVTRSCLPAVMMSPVSKVSDSIEALNTRHLPAIFHTMYLGWSLAMAFRMKMQTARTLGSLRIDDSTSVCADDPINGRPCSWAENVTMPSRAATLKALRTSSTGMSCKHVEYRHPTDRNEKSTSLQLRQQRSDGLRIEFA